MKRDDLDKACRDESGWAIALHDTARAYVLGSPEEDVTAEQLLSSAYYYAKARLERERIQDDMWGPEP